MNMVGCEADMDTFDVSNSGVAWTTSTDGLPKSSLERQEGGSHYKEFKIQPLTFIYENGIKFIEGNCIKYLCRHGRKNGEEDLMKVLHYVQMLLEMHYGVKVQITREEV